MAKRQIVQGATSEILEIFISDSTSTTGAGLPGLAFNSAGLTCYYHINTAASAVAVSLVTMTVGTFTSSGFKEVDSTNMPGVYQLCLPNAAYASGKSVFVMLKGATDMAPLPFEIEVTQTNNQDAVRFGMTALPNVAAAANGGLPTVDASNAVKVQSGTGANQISLSSGLVRLSSAGAGDIWDVVLASHLTAGSTGFALNAAGSSGDPWATTLPGAYGAGTAGKIVGDNINATISSRSTFAGGAVASVTGNVGGNVTGSVGSVVGAVGSVAGAVGSVAGAVGSVTGNVGGNLLGTLTSTERNAIADAVLDRNMATGTDSGSPTVRTPRQALYALRNKVAIASTVLTVYKTDDSTPSWTGTVSMDAAALPVTSVDPA